jgi:NADH pyrophosphatase NudC (nudix superfamily)
MCRVGSGQCGVLLDLRGVLNEVMRAMKTCPKCGTRMQYQPIGMSALYVCPKCKNIVP